ncbi:lysozyme [Dyella japonica]|uniref:Lysozyme n=1 Tax=Dyella japonica TaxID=231455 RepID=A0ABV2JZ01_9GAMM
MLPSQNAINLVKESEGLRLSAYRDVGGVPTIGYGHTAGVQMGQVITEDQANQFLADDLDIAGGHVEKLVSVPLTQGQFDALTDFTFNLGFARLRDSTLLRVLNRGDYQAAAQQFKFWTLAAGQVMPGLVKRRAAETALFLSDSVTT